MLDAHCIPDMFAALEGKLPSKLAPDALGLAGLAFHDPHDIADRWLAATSEGQLEALRKEAEDLHRRTIRELHRDYDKLAHKASWMRDWRTRHPERAKEANRRWREANPTWCRDYMVEYRKRLTFTPESREAYLAAARERRKRWREKQPKKPKRVPMSTDEVRAKKRAIDRDYQLRKRQAASASHAKPKESTHV